MTDIRSRIEELIEESYLATLSEERIRQDLLQFLDACYRCVDERDLEEEARGTVFRRLDDFGNMAMDLEHTEGLLEEEENDQWTAWTGQEILAHRAARLKMMVIDAIRRTDAAAADELERMRFPGAVAPKEAAVRIMPAPVSRGQRPPKQDTKVALLRAFYAALAGATLFVIGYRLLAG